MVITKEDVLARQGDLERQLKQALDTAQACYGAIEDCAYWLKVLEKQAEPKVEQETD